MGAMSRATVVRHWCRVWKIKDKKLEEDRKYIRKKEEPIIKKSIREKEPIKKLCKEEEIPKEEEEIKPRKDKEIKKEEAEIKEETEILKKRTY